VTKGITSSHGVVLKEVENDISAQNLLLRPVFLFFTSKGYTTV